MKKMLLQYSLFHLTTLSGSCRHFQIFLNTLRSPTDVPQRKEIKPIIIGLREYIDSFPHYVVQTHTVDKTPSMLSVKDGAY